MSIENLIEAATILRDHGMKGYTLAAEHDELYLGDVREAPMKLSVIRKLYKLGLFISDGYWKTFV